MEPPSIHRKPCVIPCFASSVSGGDVSSPGWVGAPVFTGTSAAAPTLAGIAALALSYWESSITASDQGKGTAPPAGPSRIRQQAVRDAIIFGTIPMSESGIATPPSEPHPNSYAGYGMVMADRVIRHLKATACDEAPDISQDNPIGDCAGTPVGWSCSLPCDDLTCALVGPNKAGDCFCL